MSFSMDGKLGAAGAVQTPKEERENYFVIPFCSHKYGKYVILKL
jgi:hypothetical protein